MPRHIGIVACSAEGAALCYRTLCIEGAAQAGGYAHPEVSMHTPSLADYVACLERGDWRGVAERMLGSARKLAAIGAELLILDDARSPLPTLDSTRLLARAALHAAA